MPMPFLPQGSPAYSNTHATGGVITLSAWGMSSTPSLGLAPNILPGAHAAGMVAQHCSGALPHKELPGSVVLAHQLPPLKYFTGETQGEGEEIDDCLE